MAKRPNPLEAEIRRMLALYHCDVGVAAQSLKGGPVISVRGDEYFPMASTFKVAVAATVLRQVDEGRLALDQMLAVDPEMVVPSDVIANRFIHPGIALSIMNHIEVMITESDNTATDVLMKAVGGPRVVTACLRSIKLKGQRVDRDTAGIIRDFYQVGADGYLKDTLEAALKADPALQRRGSEPNPDYDDDARDTTTPVAMASLLSKIFNGAVLSPAGTAFLIGVMERCRTGPRRIKGMLPDGTVVAHKTGTIGGTINDAGVMTLPGGGKVAAAIYIKKSAIPVAHRERLIAQIARAIYDYYLFRQ
jgi:beta-lactamase class A